MLKNMRVFIAFRVFLYPGRKVATSFANIYNGNYNPHKKIGKLPWILEQQEYDL